MGPFKKDMEKAMMSHLSVVDDQLEEGVHQQDAIWQDAAAVQQNRLKKIEKTKNQKQKHHRWAT